METHQTAKRRNFDIRANGKKRLNSELCPLLRCVAQGRACISKRTLEMFELAYVAWEQYKRITHVPAIDGQRFEWLVEFGQCRAGALVIVFGLFEPNSTCVLLLSRPTCGYFLKFVRFSKRDQCRQQQRTCQVLSAFVIQSALWWRPGSSITASSSISQLPYFPDMSIVKRRRLS